MYLFLLCLLLFSTSTKADDPALVELQLTCQSDDDFFQLLYSICRQVILCQELYYLEPPGVNMTTLASQREFARFEYHLSLIDFYNTPLSESIVSDIWPLIWAPNITVLYNTTGDSCASSFNQTSLDNMLFIYSVLDIMKTYKRDISNEHYCDDYNEIPLFDLYTHQIHCICPSNKICYKEGSWRELIFYLFINQNLLLILFGVSVFLVGIRLLRNNLRPLSGKQ